MNSQALIIDSDNTNAVTIMISLLMLLAALALVAGFAMRSEFNFITPEELAQQQIEPSIDPAQDPQGHAKQVRLQQLTERFDQAIVMLHAKQYDFAVTALHRVIELSPNMPEAHVNMGFAMLGLKRYKAAGDFFASAIRLKPYQGNAYWGLAVSLNELGDTEGALGAMRSYIHLAPPNDPYVRKARSALWEWESKLKRGPLPQAEADWIEQRGKEWDDRNSPELDKPNQTTGEIDLLSEQP
ncbi:hypothetical protein MNBD_GAMMA16-441 [hydrothermal vent metagenome]|uniref:Uncharacterized protein n=1 Tax=hydrothermal vent metagenome TaxID=652676 RepID=A0A3B0YUP5_9ZZZZ